MGELAILAQDATKSDADRALYTEEFNQLKAGLSDSTQATFNGVKMFSSEPKAVTVDENAKTVELPAVDLEAAAREVVAEGTDLSKLENAAAALRSVKEHSTKSPANALRSARRNPGWRRRAINSSRPALQLVPQVADHRHRLRPGGNGEDRRSGSATDGHRRVGPQVRQPRGGPSSDF